MPGQPRYENVSSANGSGGGQPAGADVLPDLYLLAVGIDDYQSDAFANTIFCEKDAAAISTALEEAYVRTSEAGRKVGQFHGSVLTGRKR